VQLDYDPSVPRDLLVRVERRARRLGVPLGTLELLGQDPGVAAAFLATRRAPAARTFVDTLDLARLESLRTARGPSSPAGAPGRR